MHTISRSNITDGELRVLGGQVIHSIATEKSRVLGASKDTALSLSLLSMANHSRPGKALINDAVQNHLTKHDVRQSPRFYPTYSGQMSNSHSPAGYGTSYLWRTVLNYRGTHTHTHTLSSAENI